MGLSGLLTRRRRLSCEQHTYDTKPNGPIHTLEIHCLGKRILVAFFVGMFTHRNRRWERTRASIIQWIATPTKVGSFETFPTVKFAALFRMRMLSINIGPWIRGVCVQCSAVRSGRKPWKDRDDRQILMRTKAYLRQRPTRAHTCACHPPTTLPSIITQIRKPFSQRAEQNFLDIHYLKPKPNTTNKKCPRTPTPHDAIP